MLRLVVVDDIVSIVFNLGIEQDLAKWPDARWQQRLYIGTMTDCIPFELCLFLTILIRPLSMSPAWLPCGILPPWRIFQQMKAAGCFGEVGNQGVLRPLNDTAHTALNTLQANSRCMVGSRRLRTQLGVQPKGKRTRTSRWGNAPAVVSRYGWLVVYKFHIYQPYGGICSI